MNKDIYKTEVIFRKWNRKDFKGVIMALFPYVIDTTKGDVMSYEHIGQHSGADYGYCINATIPAKYDEYKDLFEELEFTGYNLKIIQRQNYSKYLRELKRVRNIK